MFSVNFREDHCSETNKRYQLKQSKVNFQLKEGYMQRNHRYVIGKQPSKYWYTEEKTGIQFQKSKISTIIWLLGGNNRSRKHLPI